MFNVIKTFVAHFKTSLLRFVYYLKSLRRRIFISSFDRVSGRHFLRGNHLIFIFSKSTFPSVTFRPKRAPIQILPSSLGIPNLQKKSRDTAIVIQGPIILKDDFTYETLLFYKQIFANEVLILSTWIDTPSYMIDKVKSIGVEIVLSQLPPNPGYGNVNMQIVTTTAGLKRARDLNLKYVVKTRSDFRIYASSAILYLKSLLSEFKSEPNNEKIVISNVATCRHRVYGATDILQFGALNTMLTYWNGGTWEEELKTHFGGKLLINETPLICEIFLCARYLRRRGLTLDFTLECWWKALARHYIVVDLASLDGFWYKYDWNFEQRFIRSYLRGYPRAVSFADWIQLYSGRIEGWPIFDDTGKILFQERWSLDDAGKLIQLQC